MFPMFRKWIQVFLAIILCGTCAGLEAVSSKASLKRPLVSLTFDDGWSSIYDTVYPLLDWYNYPGTFFIFTDVIGQEGRLTADQLRGLHEAGHEIGSHSLNHDDLTALLPTLLEEQLSESKKILEEIIQSPVSDFAVPYGRVSPLVLKYLAKSYQSNRSLEDGYNSMSRFDPYQIKVKIVSKNTSLHDVEKWLDTAKQNNMWIVLQYQKVDRKNGVYNTNPEEFENHLKSIRERKLTVVTIRDGLKEILEQILE
jgi:peptidoglycan/xylan/chitin deacetylase (PgdA/CDA1 family)